MSARVRYVLSVTLEPKARIGTNVPAVRVPKDPAGGSDRIQACRFGQPRRSFTPAGHVLSIPT